MKYDIDTDINLSIVRNKQTSSSVCLISLAQRSFRNDVVLTEDYSCGPGPRFLRRPGRGVHPGTREERLWLLLRSQLSTILRLVRSE